jgi:hypothetical protein
MTSAVRSAVASQIWVTLEPLEFVQIFGVPMSSSRSVHTIDARALFHIRQSCGSTTFSRAHAG